ncbi:uncharacterized protein G2W53_001231 [Senna tora]|uniref:Uncharacterized protein n=1 Tax=Senna tora TaxID=362788 RepID=A0A834XI68_9FABA|nr:uncharacterized protein G2W53_001231 [Senna tora]
MKLGSMWNWMSSFVLLVVEGIDESGLEAGERIISGSEQG